MEAIVFCIFLFVAPIIAVLISDRNDPGYSSNLNDPDVP